MKIGNPANYFVRVSSRAWEGDEQEAAPYAGTYTLDLNRVVDVAFVDDVAGFGPPWNAAELPPAGTQLDDPALARLATLLRSSYVVTPNDALAGQTESFVRPWGASDRRQALVIYVTTADFGRLRDDLEDLWDVAGGVQSAARRDELLDHPALQFIEEKIIAPGRLTAADNAAIGRE